MTKLVDFGHQTRRVWFLAYSELDYKTSNSGLQDRQNYSASEVEIINSSFSNCFLTTNYTNWTNLLLHTITEFITNHTNRNRQRFLAEPANSFNSLHLRCIVFKSFCIEIFVKFVVVIYMRKLYIIIHIYKCVLLTDRRINGIIVLIFVF